MTHTDYATLPLRERKKALTRDTLIATANRLFEERGFDQVTVAEIANAANVSVKTLFMYFRSKEDLAFADTSLLDSLLAALQQRAADQTHAEVIASVLSTLLRADERNLGLEGYHRGFGESEALRSGLLRLWQQYEDQISALLASEAGDQATPALRLYAMQLVAIVRSMTSPELRAAVSGLSPSDAIAVSEQWLRTAAQKIGPMV